MKNDLGVKAKYAPSAGCPGTSQYKFCSEVRNRLFAASGMSITGGRWDVVFRLSFWVSGCLCLGNAMQGLQKRLHDSKCSYDRAHCSLICYLSCRDHGGFTSADSLCTFKTPAHPQISNFHLSNRFKYQASPTQRAMPSSLPWFAISFTHLLLLKLRKIRLPVKRSEKQVFACAKTIIALIQIDTYHGPCAKQEPVFSGLDCIFCILHSNTQNGGCYLKFVEVLLTALVNRISADLSYA